MEENYSLNQQPQNPKQDRFSKFAFYKVGIIEAGILGIILLLTAGILNYFNILPLSEMFPKYLSFLPRQQSEQRIIPKTQIVTTPTPFYEPAPIFAKNAISNLLSDVLHSNLIPSDLKFEKQNIEDPYGRTFYEAVWETKNDENFIVGVEYNRENTLTDRQVTISFPTTSIQINGSISSQIISQYFKIEPKQEFICVNLPNENTGNTFCEAFWQEDNGIKRGINITIPINKLRESKIFYCERTTKESTGYLWKSCDLKYKDTGAITN